VYFFLVSVNPYHAGISLRNPVSASMNSTNFILWGKHNKIVHLYLQKRKRERKMKKLYIIFMVMVLALTIVTPVGVANANSGVEVSGEYEITITNAECLNDYCPSYVIMVCLSYASTYEGDIAGSAQECFYCGFCVNSDTTRRVGIQTFSGMVLGREGTYTAYVCHRSLGKGDFEVEQTVISGTDELAGIQGTLVFMVTQTDLGVWEGTYSGNVTFSQ